MNEYDSGKIADIAKAAAGYEVTDDINEADLVVFNTCSIPVSYTHLTLPTT